MNFDSHIYHDSVSMIYFDHDRVSMIYPYHDRVSMIYTDHDRVSMIYPDHDRVSMTENLSIEPSFQCTSKCCRISNHSV